MAPDEWHHARQAQFQKANQEHAELYVKTRVNANHQTVTGDNWNLQPLELKVREL